MTNEGRERPACTGWRTARRDGRLNGESLGNGLTIDRQYGEVTGRLQNIHADVGR
jgi:hypothetical protein